jgi:hypothetical protein
VYSFFGARFRDTRAVSPVFAEKVSWSGTELAFGRD